MIEKNPNRGERVPRRLVIPYVEKWIHQYNIDHPPNTSPVDEDGFGSEPYYTTQSILDEHPEWAEVHEAQPILFLADKAGINPSTIGKWVRQFKTTAEGHIGFFDVDRLFTAMRYLGLWQEDEELCSIRNAYEEARPE